MATKRDELQRGADKARRASQTNSTAAGEYRAHQRYLDFTSALRNLDRQEAAGVAVCQASLLCTRPAPCPLHPAAQPAKEV